MSRISIALRKASTQRQTHNLDDIRNYPSVEKFLNQRNRKITLDNLLWISIIAFILFSIGGIRVFYQKNRDNLKNNAKDRNYFSYIITQYDNKEISLRDIKSKSNLISDAKQKTLYNKKIDSGEDKQALLIQSQLTTDSKPKSLSFYTIQVGSFLNPNYAETTLQRLRENTHFSVAISEFPSPQGIWHRVHVGEFESLSQAENSLSRIQKDYNGRYIIKIQRPYAPESRL